MQEVFEKIIEKLEENQTIVFNLGGGKPKQSIDLERAIEIVKKEAEKYNNGHFGCNTNGEHEKCNGCGLTDCKNRNKIWFGVSDDNNGWVPCSERLPEEAFGCLVTVMDCNPSTQTEFENILPYFVGYDGETWNDADGEEIPFEVIAWQRLPLPFKDKE
ncbi:MAG: DUF551 domain-containing protein [Agathobacter sp.]|nr:DUF551 domain-containing protein [Agathobacter sp.]